MFDVEVGGVEYRESEHSEPADEIVLSETAGGVGLGLTICYDLRFPELYRILALRGARIVTVPANFTRVTGEAHWEVLLRARAIENQVFVIAPGQGRGPGAEGDSYGNSMIVDPWGEVLARAGGEGECVRRRRPRPRRARTRSGRSCRASPTASRAPTAGPRRRRV